MSTHQNAARQARDSPWPDDERVNLDFLVHALCERRSSFRWSYLGDFPRGLQILFDQRLRVCLDCMSEAFHTVIFSMRLLSKCPLHGSRLVNQCPSCGLRIDSRAPVRSKNMLPHCACGFAWTTNRAIRLPEPNPTRDAVLQEVVEWIERTAKCYWTQLPKEPSSAPPSSLT